VLVVVDYQGLGYGGTSKLFLRIYFPGTCLKGRQLTFLRVPFSASRVSDRRDFEATAVHAAGALDVSAIQRLSSTTRLARNAAIHGDKGSRPNGRQRGAR
jgi:hypothetical protein